MKNKIIWEWVPCQNCGKLVHICLPFYGCVFCDECMEGESYRYTATAKEFVAWGEVK